MKKFISLTPVFILAGLATFSIGGTRVMDGCNKTGFPLTFLQFGVNVFLESVCESFKNYFYLILDLLFWFVIIYLVWFLAGKMFKKSMKKSILLLILLVIVAAVFYFLKTNPYVKPFGLEIFPGDAPESALKGKILVSFPKSISPNEAKKILEKRQLKILGGWCNLGDENKCQGLPPMYAAETAGCASGGKGIFYNTSSEFVVAVESAKEGYFIDKIQKEEPGVGARYCEDAKRVIID